MTKRALKKRIVREAHRFARCTFPEVEDFGSHCLLISGAVIRAAQEHGIRLVLQAGSAYWPRVTDETDDGVEANRFGYEWEPDSPRTLARLRQGLLPELHVWAADPITQEVVDLTAGAFVSQCANLTGMPWKAPPPPAWFWGRFDALPPLASYRPAMDATMLAANLLTEALSQPSGIIAVMKKTPEK